MHTAAHKKQVADAVTKIRVPHERRHFAVGAGAVERTQVRAGFGLNNRRRHHPFLLDEGFDIFAEDVVDFGDRPLSGLLLEQLPILPRITGRVDHDKPILTAFRGIAGYEVTGFVDINSRVLVQVSSFHGGKLGGIIFAKENVVAVEFRERFLNAPVKNERGGRFFLRQDTLGLPLLWEQFSVSKEHIHVTDHLVEGVLFVANAYAGCCTIAHQDFVHFRVKMKRHPLAARQFVDGLTDAVHPSLGQECPKMMFKMRDDGQQTGCFVGIRAVIGRKAIEELHQFRMLKFPPVYRIHRPEQVQLRDFEHRFQYFQLGPGAQFVEALFEKSTAGDLVLTLRIRKHLQYAARWDIQYVFDLLCELLLSGVRVNAGAIFPEIIADDGQPLVGEVIPGVFARQLKKLIHILRHGKQRRPQIKAVIAQGKLGELAAGAICGLENLHLVSLNSQPDGGGESGNPGSNDSSTQKLCVLMNDVQGVTKERGRGLGGHHQGKILTVRIS